MRWFWRHAWGVVRRTVCRQLQIPTLLVAQLARQSVTVALSGMAVMSCLLATAGNAHANALRRSAHARRLFGWGRRRAAAAMLALLAVHWLPALARQVDKLPSVLGNDDLALYQAQMSYLPAS